ncbi:Oidioi.mRNA.OKI2018_I69.chr2.g4581.t1.cds [Oikopleura dioica]|uniref:Oidioi.mRNA.OKI2018_I69.chr2.g4581.t1.cds n=1 Tax=Oikopleura dioica TaxID=34765 RepID=A0ABN7T6X1_OIKDI|nr:Oidioi.mRNA.OKI2018_I69.chr2.g4581.t1.cds [Oikopleura dioica]
MRERKVIDVKIPPRNKKKDSRMLVDSSSSFAEHTYRTYSHNATTYSRDPIFEENSFLQRSISQPSGAPPPAAAYYINANSVTIAAPVPRNDSYPGNLPDSGNLLNATKLFRPSGQFNSQLHFSTDEPVYQNISKRADSYGYAMIHCYLT